VPTAAGGAAGGTCCVRMNPPGASGLAGGAGWGLGVMAAFVATEGGSLGARAAPAAPIAEMPAPDDGEGGGVLGGGNPGARDSGGAEAATAGVTVWAWPCGSVIVTKLVVSLITTVL